MRLKKGDRVEVLSKEEVSSGSWCSAEIISGKGHMYNVKYGWFPTADQETVGRVPRKAIRPCPPPARRSSWSPGDLVEVFHNLSWKTAKIIMVVGFNTYMVKILGLCIEDIVQQSHLRVPQCWQDGKWIVLGKHPASCDTVIDERQKDESVMPGITDCCFLFGNDIEFQKPHSVQYRPKKTEFPHGSPEAYNVAPLKRRAIEKDGNDNDSCASSVGSSGSTTDFVPRLMFSVSHKRRSVESEGCCSAAESSTECGYDDGHLLNRSEESQAETQKSDLRRFCSFLKSLYVAGPLSWEDEEKVTNLRCELHISNDIYLNELQNLRSSGSRPLT